jgi:hypothetical protein
MTEGTPIKVSLNVYKELIMKKMLFVFSVLTLLSYGCNKDSGKGAGSSSGTDMQREEDQATPSASPDSNMGSGSQSSPASDSNTQQ